MMQKLIRLTCWPTGLIKGWLRTMGVGLCIAATSVSAWASTVRVETSLGVIDIELFDTAAPATVANFLSYVQSGAFDSTFFHRSVPGFIIQTGGYRWNTATDKLAPVPTNAPVVNEFSATRSNLRGTVAMAKLVGDPDSATSQWFVNLADNSTNLDAQNGGFTVFGKVVGNGMTVVDAIAAIQPQNINASSGGPFDSTPLILPVINQTITAANLAMVTRVTVLPTQTLSLGNGWNLAGNGYESGFAVASVFGEPSKIATVWKWLPNALPNAAWAFYSPGLSAIDLAAYASSKGYQVLNRIEAGEGFWVNVKIGHTASLPTGTPLTSGSFKANGLHALGANWSLVATGDRPTPAQFNAALSPTSPTAGNSPINLTTMWAWRSAQAASINSAGWYFWAPTLAADGNLSNYLGTKGYLDFATLPGITSGTLSPSTGFWINRP